MCGCWGVVQWFILHPLTTMLDEICCWNTILRLLTHQKFQSKKSSIFITVKNRSTFLTLAIFWTLTRNPNPNQLSWDLRTFPPQINKSFLMLRISPEKISRLFGLFGVWTPNLVDDHLKSSEIEGHRTPPQSTTQPPPLEQCFSHYWIRACINGCNWS